MPRLRDDARWRGGRRPGNQPLRCAHCDQRRDAVLACIACEAETCAMCADPCRGCAQVDELHAIRRGARPAVGPDTRAGSEKTLRFARTLGDSRDVLLAPLGVVVRTLGDPRRHGYFPRAASFILADTLDRAGLTTLEGPHLARVEGGRIWHAHVDAEVAWLVPLAQGVEIRFRPLPADGGPPRPIAVDAHALPEPWRDTWAPPTPTFADGTGVACAHCNTNAPEYRVVRGASEAFVCPACGRSFRHATLTARRS